MSEYHDSLISAALVGLCAAFFCYLVYYVARIVALLKKRRDLKRAMQAAEDEFIETYKCKPRGD